MNIRQLSNNLSVTFDIKRKKMRIFKSTLRKIGCPKYIQILISFTEQKMIIRPVEQSSENPTTKIDLFRLNSDDSCEITSMLFINKITKGMNIDDTNCSYRLTGIYNDKFNIVILPFNSIAKIKNEE